MPKRARLEALDEGCSDTGRTRGEKSPITACGVYARIRKARCGLPEGGDEEAFNISWFGRRKRKILFANDYRRAFALQKQEGGRRRREREKGKNPRKCKQFRHIEHSGRTRLGQKTSWGKEK